MKGKDAGVRHPIRTGKNGRFVYPWPWMHYGDYCILPKSLAKKGASAAYMYGQGHELWFRCSAYGTQGRVKVTHIGYGPHKTPGGVHHT